MPEIPSAPEPLVLLLQTLIDGQRRTDQKLDSALARMATKDDVRQLLDNQSKFASQDDLERIEDRVASLEGNRIPKWFWTVIAIVVAIATPLVQHYWK